MAQSNLLKADILKILSKDVSGGANTRKPYKSAQQPLTFFGGQDNQPYYPSAQEPNPAANPMTPIVPKIMVLESGQKSGKRPTYKSAKTPLTFFGGAKKCKEAKAAAKETCAAEKKAKKKRPPSAYNLFIKDFFSKNSGATMKTAAAAWKASKSGAPPPPKPARPAIKLTSFGDVPPPPPGPPPKKAAAKKRRNTPPPPPPGPPPKKAAATKPKKADSDELIDGESDKSYKIRGKIYARFGNEIYLVEGGDEDGEGGTVDMNKEIKTKYVLNAVAAADKKEAKEEAKAAKKAAKAPKKAAKAPKKAAFKDDPQALKDSSVDQYGIDDDEPPKLSAAAVARAKTELAKTGLTRAEANKLSPTELFGMLPVELRRIILDPKQTGVKVGNRMLWKDFDIRNDNEDYYEARDYIRDNLNDSAAYYMDWTDYLNKSENKFYKAFYGKYSSLTEKQQDKYSDIEEKLMEKMDTEASEIWDKLNKDFEKSVGKKETDTEDGWSMRFFQFVDKAGYGIVYGSDTPEYYKKRRGGRMPNTGKPLPKRQLQSYKKKLPSKPRTKKNSAWMAHLAQFRKANPSIAAKDMMKAAKQTYKSGGAHCGGEMVLQQDGGASIKHDIKMTQDTHTMPDGTVMSGKSHSSEIKKLVAAKTAGNVPTAPEKMAEKSDQDQSKIMVDIMNSYDEFNKRFEDISNSNTSRDNKRTQYNSERERLDKYHQSVLENYKETLSKDKMEIEEKAYKYAADTYNIGVDNLSDGAPQQRVDFENFDENDTITAIIDKALAYPRGPLDRARSFYSVPIEPAAIQSFNPVIPAFGKMATIYPYGRQQAEKKAVGGKIQKSPKQMLKELAKNMFVRDMVNKFPDVSKKKIIDLYNKRKNDIFSILTDAIVDAMQIRGGADCAANQYKSGDRCYNKQERMTPFVREEFFAEQKRQADAKQYRDNGMVKPAEARTLPSIDSRTKTSSDAAMPLPSPKPQDNSSKNFVEKFSAAVTPSESGPIFGTDGRDISDPKSWVDTAANIFIGTAEGVKSIFDALGDLF